ncbi:MAG: PEP-CTERM sorting domain-containing protein [Opitutales bacterium]|nr:PEP-CTERM sorting domain-containing protein [Opitutales bacterium]
MKNIYSFAAIVLAANIATAATYLRNSEVSEADWTGSTTWVDPSTYEPIATPPTSSDNVRIWYGTTNISATAAATNISMKAGESGAGDTPAFNIASDLTLSDSFYVEKGNVNITAGTVDVKGGGDNKGIVFYSGNISLSGTSETKSNTFFSGDNGVANAGPLTINISDSAKLTATNVANGFGFGINARTQDVLVNITDNAILTGRLKVGIGNNDTKPTYSAKATVNISGNAAVNADYINLYRNGTLNVSGSAVITITNDARLGDMSNLNSESAATADSVTFSGSSRLNINTSNNNGGAMIFNGATVTFEGDSVLNVNRNVYVGKHYQDTFSSGHLVLKDNVQTFSGANLILLHENATVEIYGSNIKPLSGQTYNFTNLGASAYRSQMGGTIKYIADADGISQLKINTIVALDTDKNTGYDLLLDFTNFVLTEGETKQMAIIYSNSSSNVIAAYETYQDDLISVIKAKEQDTYSIYASGKTLFIDYTSAVIPEPATYASLFGALAIAFALMRRRVRK